jgi:hypothetical protein
MREACALSGTDRISTHLVPFRLTADLLPFPVLNFAPQPGHFFAPALYSPLHVGHQGISNTSQAQSGITPPKLLPSPGRANVSGILLKANPILNIGRLWDFNLLDA